MFRSIYFISARSFYAQQDTKTPLYISLFTISVNIALAVWFTFGLNLGVYGFAWAAVIVSILEMAILFYVMSRRIEGLFDKVFISAVTRMLSAAGFTAIVTYIMVTILPLSADDQSFFSSFPKFLLISGVSLLSYIIICRLFKLPEVEPILHRVRDILFKQPKLDP